MIFFSIGKKEIFTTNMAWMELKKVQGVLEGWTIFSICSWEVAVEEVLLIKLKCV
jgi:hypothetical protein